jgi:hypothetical protein
LGVRGRVKGLWGFEEWVLGFIGQGFWALGFEVLEWSSKYKIGYIV